MCRQWLTRRGQAGGLAAGGDERTGQAGVPQRGGDGWPRRAGRGPN